MCAGAARIPAHAQFCWSVKRKRQFFLPDGVSPDQLKATTMQWLARPEANLDLAATLLVWGATKDAYGCR